MFLNMISAFNRLTLQSISQIRIPIKSISTNSPLLFRTTPCLLAEPLKKKKKLDPAVVRAREERKRKKLEKQIRRLQRNARQLKPIDECEIPLELLDNQKARMRNIEIPDHVQEERIKIIKSWSTYRLQKKLADIQMLDRVTFAQQKALDELRKESEELYQEAVQIDPSLVPFKTQGCVETAAIENYEAPDGDYTDTSRKWE